MATVYSENDQLGTLRGKYGANLHSAKLNLYFGVFGLALLGTGFIILGISNTSPALSLNFLGLGLVGLLIATGIYFFAYRGLLKTRVTVHDQGFSFHDWRGRNHFYRWNEITAIPATGILFERIDRLQPKS